MSELNAPLALFSASQPSYETWTEALDRICRQRLTLSLHDLSDLPTRAAYDAGTGPTLFFEETLIPYLREQHGEVIDELMAIAASPDAIGRAPAAEDR